MKIKWRNILIVLGLLLAVVLLIDFNRRVQQLDRMTAQLQSVSAEATSVMQTQVGLLTQVSYASSDKSVEAWAYQNKWVRAGEHPIGLVPSGEVTPTPEPTPSSQVQNIPNWRIWWQLFFGGSN